MTDIKGKKTNPVISFFNSEHCFRFVFIGSLFFASLCLVRFYFYVICGVSMIWALYLFIRKMIINGSILRVRNRRLIYLFLGCSALTCILNIRSNFFVNMYMVAWMAVCFFMFYGIHRESKNKCRRETQQLLEFINAATTLIMIAGLVLLVIFPKGFRYEGDAFAIYESRFVGIIFNANVTAFYALTAFIACTVLIAMRSSAGTLNRQKLFYYSFCMLINLLSVFLSDSNDSLLMLIVYCCFITFYIFFRGQRRSILKFILRIIGTAIACVLIAVMLLIFRTIVQTGVSHLLSLLTPTAQISTGVTAPGGNVVIRPDEAPKPPAFGHENTNLDSGRFYIWKQALCLFQKFPLFGMGKANLVDYGETYLGGLRYEDLHNGLLTIMVCYGIAGLIIFLIFAITVAKTLFKAIFRYKAETRSDRYVLVLLAAFAAAYCAYSMFEVALLVDIAYRIVIFWLLLGTATCYANSYEHSSFLKFENIPERSLSIYRIAAYRHRNCSGKSYTESGQEK